RAGQFSTDIGNSAIIEQPHRSCAPVMGFLFAAPLPNLLRRSNHLVRSTALFFLRVPQPHCELAKPPPGRGPLEARPAHGQLEGGRRNCRSSRGETRRSPAHIEPFQAASGGTPRLFGGQLAQLRRRTPLLPAFQRHLASGSQEIPLLGLRKSPTCLFH